MSNQSLIFIEKLYKTFWISKKFICSLNLLPYIYIYISDYFAYFDCISFNFSSFISLFFHFSKIMDTAPRRTTTKIQQQYNEIRQNPSHYFRAGLYTYYYYYYCYYFFLLRILLILRILFV